MKTILIKPLWFTVITILCLVLVTLFAASGCDKTEILPKHYTVNFVGEGVGIEPQSITHGDYATEPKNLEREGYNFEGWFTDNGTFANEWDFKTGIVTQDTTLYAKWEENTLQEINLQGTKWKLIGIVDVQSGNLTELEPKDCDECFTLIFDTDDTFSGRTVNNIMWGEYEIDYNRHTLRATDFAVSEALDTRDGELYSQILGGYFFRKIQSFTVRDTHPRILHLYYNNGENYLKYKKIGG
jgi:uncharacterized repeat protein (TIGR02543 family)